MAHTGHVTRDDQWLMIDVPGVGVTQAPNVADAELMARELIAVTTDQDLAEITVHLTFGAAAENH